MSEVYFIEFSSYEEVLQKALENVGINEIVTNNDFVALKAHFGEKNSHGYVEPKYITPIVEEVKKRNGIPFLTDANTIYAGHRADAVRHLVLTHEHGFTIEECGAPIIIADGLRGNSYVEEKISQRHFKKVKIARGIYYADALILVTHFKGHMLTGFGGSLKNMGMGCGAKPGKYEMHNSVVPTFDISKCTGCGLCIKWCGSGALKLLDEKIKFDAEKCSGCGECILTCTSEVVSIPWDDTSANVQEKMVEYAYGVVQKKQNKLLCINFINNVTKECDCFHKKTAPLVPDIGILVSKDPVAIDQASVDLVNEIGRKSCKGKGDVFRKVYPNVDWNIQLNYGQKIGLGSKKYELHKKS